MTAAWYDDIRVLWAEPLDFFPAKRHSEHQRLNAIVRLVSYASLAAFLVGGKGEVLVIGVALIAALSLSVRFAAGRRRVPGNDDAADDAANDAANDGLMDGARVREVAREASGRVSAAGGSAAGGPAAARGRGSHKCQLSTPENPFANMLLSDLATRPDRPKACPYDQHAHLIERNFNLGLVRNVYDVYDKENSQRQFMTMPVTTSAPDVAAFARYCYGGYGKKTCKEDTSKCTGR